MWEYSPRPRGTGGKTENPGILGAGGIHEGRGRSGDPQSCCNPRWHRRHPLPGELREPRDGQSYPGASGGPVRGRDGGVRVLAPPGTPSLPTGSPAPPAGPAAMATRTSRRRALRRGARARRDTRWRFAAVSACGAMAEEDPAAAASGSGSESEEGVSGDGKNATGSSGGLHRSLRGSGRSPGQDGHSGGRRGLAGDFGPGIRAGDALGGPGSPWERALGPSPRPRSARLGL